VALGDRYKEHVDFFEGLPGYHETKKKIDENYKPASRADKSFNYRWPEKNHVPETGRHEVTRMLYEVKIVYSKGQNVAYSDFYKSLWDEIDSVEKQYLAFGDGAPGRDRVWVDQILTESLDENFELVTFLGHIMFQRSLET
jgi:hypothetical protein